ncbi:MAG: protein kinase [Gammaproteobacteria bacterium]|nr:protein kinase [Gammaproteobacteria bacterium]
MFQRPSIQPSPVPTEHGIGRPQCADLPALPRALADRYQVSRDLVAQRTEANLLLVESRSQSGLQAVAKLYHPGIQPKSEVLQWLNTEAPRYVVRLLEYGQSDGIGYELLEYAEQGSLREWMAEGALAEIDVWEILTELGAALKELHERNIPHRNLKPENILVRHRQPLQLALTDFGVTLLTDTAPGFTTHRCAMRYGAPETVTGTTGAAADYWSLGMILLEALTGRHPFADLSMMVIRYQLQVRPVPVQDVAEPWRTLCRGLLLRDPQQRWSAAEVHRWWTGDDRLKAPVDAAQPEAITFRPHRFYRLTAGVECRTARELAAQIAHHWEEAREDLARGAIGEWLRCDLSEQEVSRAALEVLEIHDMDDDERLVRLLAHLAPDLPPVWKQWSLAANDLAQVAQAARDGDAASQTLLLELDRVPPDILGIYAAAGNAECQWLRSAWRAMATEYERIWQMALTYGMPAKGRPEAALVLAELLLATVSPAFQEQLQKEITILASALGQRPAWLDSLLSASVQGGVALALKVVLRWLPLMEEIQRYTTPRLEALLKEFAILHRSPDFRSALDQFDQNLRDGIYDHSQAVEQALDALRQDAQSLAEVLRRYYALSEQIAVNSAACPLLRQWQPRIAAPRYEDARALEQDLTRAFRWRIRVDGWERPAASPLKWEHDHRRLPGAPSGKTAVTFSPNGRWLASGGVDRAVRLWSVESGSCVKTLTGHSGAINAVAFSPDERLIASGGDRTIRLWRVNGGPCLAAWRGHAGTVNAIAFSPDGQWLVSGAGDRTVRLWRVDSGQCVAVLAGHIGGVSAVAYGPDGRLLASSGADRTVRLWRADLKQCLAVLPGRTGRVTSVALSADGRWLASGSGSFSERRRDDDTVRLWRVENRQCVAAFPGHTGSVNAVAFSPDGRLLASGSGDGTVRVWRVENRQCTAILPECAGRVTGLAFSPDGRWLASSCENGLVLWNRSQTITLELSLAELAAWEKARAGQYHEIHWLP